MKGHEHYKTALYDFLSKFELAVAENKSENVLRKKKNRKEESVSVREKSKIGKVNYPYPGDSIFSYEL